MASTEGHDINILQASDALIVGAGGGDDIYIVSAFTLAANQSVTVSDGDGTNTLQLIDGLTIKSSMVAASALQLTLSNDAVITVFDAHLFTFNVGGNAVTGDVGQDKSFQDFVTGNLGTSVPEGSGFNSGGQVTIGDAAPVQNDEVAADIGTLDTPETLDAAGGNYVFTDNANQLNNVEISNFSAGDVIEISNASQGDYNFEHDGNDMNIVYNNDGTVNKITLVGVVNPDDLLYSETLFEDFLGFDAVTYV